MSNCNKRRPQHEIEAVEASVSQGHESIEAYTEHLGKLLYNIESEWSKDRQSLQDFCNGVVK
jgi:hypothetical protein